jgi:hypothetical protein
LARCGVLWRAVLASAAAAALSHDVACRTCCQWLLVECQRDGHAASQLCVLALRGPTADGQHFASTSRLIKSCHETYARRLGESGSAFVAGVRLVRRVVDEVNASCGAAVLHLPAGQVCSWLYPVLGAADEFARRVVGYHRGL